MLDVGLHLFGHPESAGVGIRSGIGAVARQTVPQIHGKVLHRYRNELEGQKPLEKHVAGDNPLHLLAGDVQPHVVVHLGDDLLQGVVPQLRVNGGAHREDEVAHGAGGKIGAQVDGDGQSHRQLPPPPLPALAGQNGLDEHSGQILGDGGPMALGHLAQGLHRHKAHGDVEGIEGLRGSGTGVGLGLGLAQPHPGPGVPGVGVLPLLGVRGLVHVQNPLLTGNLLSQLP